MFVSTVVSVDVVAVAAILIMIIMTAMTHLILVTVFVACLTAWPFLFCLGL